MNRKQGLVISAALAMCAVMAEAQAPTGSILHVELINSTVYFRGYCALADQGKSSTKLARPATPAFPTGVGLADIVSVNGQAIKGTALEMFNGTLFTAAMTPGRAIGDFMATPGGAAWQLTFLNLDGSLIGTLEISGQGTSADLRPPGAPMEFPGGSVYSVTAGTGPFFGVHGYYAPVQDTASPERQTTDCEDPAYRRINADAGGNKRHPVLFLVPLVQPQIGVVGSAPAVYHSDLTPVTAAKPAAAGEVLISMATGLGSTRPGVDPGQPFPSYPANPVQPVVAPVGVTVNQQSADVINAIGWPGLVDTYRVDFRMPSGITTGKASIQVSSAWVNGPPVSIAVQ